MSRASLIELFKDPHFRTWNTQKEQLSAKKAGLQKNILVAGRNDKAVEESLRDQVGTALIPLEQLATYLGDLQFNYTNNPKLSSTWAVYNEILRSNPLGISAGCATSADTGVMQWQIQINDVSYKNAATTVDTALNKIIGLVKTRAVDKEPTPAYESFNIFKQKSGLDTGHVFGVTNVLLKNLFPEVLAYMNSAYRTEITQNIGNKEAHKAAIARHAMALQQLETLKKFIDEIDNVLIERDVENSMLEGFGKMDVHVSSRKNPDSAIYQFEGSGGNQFVGRELGFSIGKKSSLNAATLRGFFNEAFRNPKGADAALTTFVNAFCKLSSGTNNKFNFTTQKGSSTLKDLIADSIWSAVSGKRRKLKNVVENNVKLPSINIFSVTKDSKTFENAKKSIRSIKQKIKSAEQQVKASAPKLSTISKVNEGMTLANLESLLRSRLALQVKQNMGDGNAKNVLNFRTGRFSESASIERLTQSRAGMVSVFYNYMRYPYATFSDGGRQQYPRSRDPKLLISKSIREIGASIVGNRMRAVLV